MPDRILTTHAGSLPRPTDLIELFTSNAPDEAVAARTTSAVAEIVQAQREAGIDVVDDGEFGKRTRGAVDYGPWQSYAFSRLSGHQASDSVAGKGPASEAFQRLGYGAEELKTMLADPSDIMVEMIGRLGQLDRAAQIRVADEVFGGSAGERLVELIDEGEAGIRAMMDQAEIGRASCRERVL